MYKMPIFFASEVAALIGLNKFKTKDEALFRVISSMPKFKSLIEKMKETTGKKSEREHIAEAPAEVKESLAKAVESSLGMCKTSDIQTKIEEFKKETTSQLLKGAIEGKDAPVEFKMAAERIAKKETTIDSETVKLEKSAIVDSLSREIQKQRGTKLESVAEDKHGKDTGKAVTDRGASTRFECAEYILVGNIDGMQDGCVVETKNRKRVWNTPPIYDLIQLRCYMKMRGDVDGLLLESFPDGTTRKTKLVWDADEWDAIHTNLVAVADEIATMSSHKAEVIIKKCLL